MNSIAFIRRRSLASRHAQQTIADDHGWVWEEKSVTDWDNDLKELETRESEESTARADSRVASATWDANLGRILGWSRDVIRLAKARYRHEPAKAEPFRALNTRVFSRDKIYKLGLATRDAWATIDPAWAPLKDAKNKPITLDIFKALLKTCKSCETDQSLKVTAWRNAAAALNKRAATLDGDCVAWYTAATTQFPAGTTLGDTVRSAVPTTSGPADDVGQALLSEVVVSPGAVRFRCAAANATGYTYYHQRPGADEFVAFLIDTPQTSVELTQQPAGVHRFKASGQNSDASGPESAVLEVELVAATESTPPPTRSSTPEVSGGRANLTPSSANGAVPVMP